MHFRAGEVKVGFTVAGVNPKMNYNPVELFYDDAGKIVETHVGSPIIQIFCRGQERMVEALRDQVVRECQQFNLLPRGGTDPYTGR